MAKRSYADVPNRVVRLFLQEAGQQYDVNRQLTPFPGLTAELRGRFDNACAYCGSAGPLVEEHLVPMNRASAGLHAWGNVLPACKLCNDIKSGHAWQEHPNLTEPRSVKVEQFIKEYGYDPDVTELKVVLDRLYDLTDKQTRALVEFALVASRPHLAGMHTPSS